MNKGRLLLGIGLGALSWFAIRRLKQAREGEETPIPPGEGEENAAVSIVIYDAQGNVVPAHSPVTLNEGGNYSFSFKVRNTSTRGGIPLGVVYRLTYQVLVSGVMLARDSFNHDFGAGQEITFGPIPFTIGWDTDGQSGAIDIIAEVPATGGIVASASQFFDVASVAINYGAVITIPPL